MTIFSLGYWNLLIPCHNNAHRWKYLLYSFVFAQSFFKFHKSRNIRKLQAWSFPLWKNDFCTLYNESAKALQSSITFSYTPCIAKIYLFSFVFFSFCIHHANITYLQLLLPRLYTVSAQQINFRGRIVSRTISRFNKLKSFTLPLSSVYFKL